MKKKDIILGSSVILIALVMLLFMRIAGNTDGSQVRITVDGEEYGVYSLSEDQEIEIDVEKNHNTICIKNGEAYMDEANCPDKYCVDQGKIKGSKQTIVCLPHKLVVEIIKADEGTQSGGMDAPDTVAK